MIACMQNTQTYKQCKRTTEGTHTQARARKHTYTQAYKQIKTCAWAQATMNYKHIVQYSSKRTQMQIYQRKSTHAEEIASKYNKMHAHTRIYEQLRVTMSKHKHTQKKQACASKRIRKTMQARTSEHKHN